MFIGVYLITNWKNGKVYVGSSVNIKERWTEHKRLLNKGIHHSAHLQNAWKKFGGESFLWEVLEVMSNFTLISREQYWIDAFDSANRKYGYNVCPIAGTTLGAEIYFSSEERKRRSEAIKGDKNPNKKSKKGKDHFRYGYRKPVCKYGHPRTPDNLIHNACRTCHRENSRIYAYNKRHNIVLS